MVSRYLTLCLLDWTRRWKTARLWTDFLVRKRAHKKREERVECGVGMGYGPPSLAPFAPHADFCCAHFTLRNGAGGLSKSKYTNYSDQRVIISRTIHNSLDADDYFRSSCQNVSLQKKISHLHSCSFPAMGNVTIGRTSKVTPPPWYKEGGGGWWNLSPGVLMCFNISERFCLW